MLTIQALSAGLFDLLKATPSLGAPSDLAVSTSHANAEARHYDFMTQARQAFDHIPTATLADYESELGKSQWTAVVAWRLFLTETDDLNGALEADVLAQESLAVMCSNGGTTAKGVTELMASVSKELDLACDA